jgi:hypothetical protein
MLLVRREGRERERFFGSLARVYSFKTLVRGILRMRKMDMCSSLMFLFLRRESSDLHLSSVSRLLP